MISDACLAVWMLLGASGYCGAALSDAPWAAWKLVVASGWRVWVISVARLATPGAK